MFFHIAVYCFQVYETVLKKVRNETSGDEKAAGWLVGVLMVQVDAFPPNALVSLINQYIDYIQSGEPLQGRCVDSFLAASGCCFCFSSFGRPCEWFREFFSCLPRPHYVPYFSLSILINTRDHARIFPLALIGWPDWLVAKILEVLLYICHQCSFTHRVSNKALANFQLHAKFSSLHHIMKKYWFPIIFFWDNVQQRLMIIITQNPHL